MNENIFPLKVSQLREDEWYLWITNLYISYAKSSIPISTWLSTLSHMINGMRYISIQQNIDLQYTRFQIFATLVCFSQLMFPMWLGGDYNTWTHMSKTIILLRFYIYAKHWLYQELIEYQFWWIKKQPCNKLILNVIWTRNYYG